MVTRLENLDAVIARLDMALLRVSELPHDAVAAHELAFCLETLDEQDLPSGLGTEIDQLLRQVQIIAGDLRLHTIETPWRPKLVEPDSPFEACARLRCKLLDIAASISVLQRD
jgi:hypothetical protein